MASKADDNSDILSDINVTPLVDVVLVLLVVMMVTASAVVTKAMSVDLPTGRTGSSTPQTLTVTVTETGAWLLDERPTDAASFRATLRQRLESGIEPQALIAAAGQARHQNVVEVLDLLREERITRVAVGVTPPR
jgi:biopolymer transport protein ExbD